MVLLQRKCLAVKTLQKYCQISLLSFYSLLCHCQLYFLPCKAWSIVCFYVNANVCTLTVECTDPQSVVHLTCTRTQPFDAYTLRQNAMHPLGYTLHSPVGACVTNAYKHVGFHKSGVAHPCVHVNNGRLSFDLKGSSIVCFYAYMRVHTVSA